MNDERHPPEPPEEEPNEPEQWSENDNDMLDEGDGEGWPPLEDTEQGIPLSPELQQREEHKEQRPVSETPWDRRKEQGFLEAFVDRWRTLLFRPSEFFSRLSPSGGFGEPLMFFIVFCVVLAVFSFPAELCATYLQQWMAQGYFQWYQEMLARTGAPAELQGFVEQFFQQPVGWTDILFGQICCTVVNPLRWIITLFIVAAIYAVCGLLFSGKVDYEMVFRVLAFSEVARSSYIVNPVPILREIIFVIHWVVLLSIGFKLTGGMSTSKAVMLALLPIVVFLFLLCCCSCGLGVMFGMAAQQ